MKSADEGINSVESDTESDIDRRSFELASSHTSDDENDHNNEHVSYRDDLRVNDFPRF
jgi:hypothetical protein